MGRYMKPEEPGAEQAALAAGRRKLLVCLLERVCWGSSSEVRVSLPVARSPNALSFAVQTADFPR